MLEPRRPSLSPRLATVAACVLPGRTLADIGTDHAYIPVSLVAAGAVPAAVATEINAQPAAAARTAIAGAGLADRIAMRLGSGLSVLTPGEAATIVIAGMGGQLIRDILDQGQAVAASAMRLVLQPMRDHLAVRYWLWGHGWVLVDEHLAQEGQHIYTIIVAERATDGGAAATDAAAIAAHAVGASEAAALAGQICVPVELVSELGPLVLAKPEPLAGALVARELAEANEVLNRLATLAHDGRGRRALLQVRVAQLDRIATWLRTHGHR
jgi:tRNA A22 N-methylase